MNFLEAIINQKRVVVDAAKRKVPLGKLIAAVNGTVPRNDFKNAITRKNSEHVKVIAEIKRASPSKGTIAENVDPIQLVRDYKIGGASAVSILTEENFFKGSLLDLQNVRNMVLDVPLLRKDFIIDEYQIYESVQIGADAILLIVAAVGENDLKKFISVAKKLRLSSLVEVHNAEELDTALSAGAEMIGVNNRDLVTFKVSSEISENLARKIPKEIVSVSESGITDVEGLRSASEAGYHAVLIGEHFMRAKDRVAEVKRFVGTLSSQNSKIKSQDYNSKAKT